MGIMAFDRITIESHGADLRHEVLPRIVLLLLVSLGFFECLRSSLDEPLSFLLISLSSQQPNRIS